MISDIDGYVWGIRNIKGNSEVAVKTTNGRGKVIRFPMDDDDEFYIDQPVKIRLVVE